MKKWPFFAIFLPWMARYGSETSFLLIFSARDDLVEVSWKSDARKCQNQRTPPYFDQLSERHQTLSANQSSDDHSGCWTEEAAAYWCCALCHSCLKRHVWHTYQIKWSNVVFNFHVAMSLPSCRDGLMWPFDASTTPTIITLNILTTSPCEPRWSDVTLCCLNHSPLHHICYHPTDVHICWLSSNIKSTYIFIAF